MPPVVQGSLSLPVSLRNGRIMILLLPGLGSHKIINTASCPSVFLLLFVISNLGNFLF